MDAKPGSRVGTAVLERLLDTGFLGDRYLGQNVSDGHPVVVRLLNPRFTGGRTFGERFARIVGAAASLHHAGIAAVEDFGRAQDWYYVTTSQPSGASLRDHVQPSLARQLAIMRQAAEALAVAHEGGVPHGDLRPENIFWAYRDPANELAGTLACVTDFGLALLAEAGLPGESAIGPGSIWYRSPERCAGADMDERSDIYSFGAVLYELVTGGPPFQVKSLTEALQKHLLTEPVRPSVLCPSLPPALERLILRCLDKRPAARFQSMAELSGALGEIRILGRVEMAFGDSPPQRRSPGASSDDVGVGGRSPSPPPPSVPPRFADENVRFTVYRPSSIRVGQWYPLLAFAHLSERRTPGAGPDPLDVVKEEVTTVLGERAAQYQATSQDATAAVPERGELTFIPQVDGVEFKPRSRSFSWVDEVHREDFLLRAESTLEGTTGRGRLSVFLGSILLADVPIALRVDSKCPDPRKADMASEGASPYRKIFISYSHQDRAVVEDLLRYGSVLGDRYLRDWTDLRAGEVWSERLGTMIGEADVFQLFWSRNSMASPFVRQEWEHALSLRRANFIRPTYWEDPLPESPDRSLPPPELRRLHFQRSPVLAPRGAPQAVAEVGTPATRPDSIEGKVAIEGLETRCGSCFGIIPARSRFCRRCGVELATTEMAGADEAFLSLRQRLTVAYDFLGRMKDGADGVACLVRDKVSGQLISVRVTSQEGIQFDKLQSLSITDPLDRAGQARTSAGPPPPIGGREKNMPSTPPNSAPPVYDLAGTNVLGRYAQDLGAGSSAVPSMRMPSPRAPSSPVVPQSAPSIPGHRRLVLGAILLILLAAVALVILATKAQGR